MEKKRNLNLDLIKVISCFAVVGLHTLKCDVSVLNSVFYYLCGFAIPVFFMSSGYILVNRDAISGQHIFKKIINILLVVAIWNIIIESAKLTYHLLIKKQTVSLLDIISAVFGSLIQKGIMFHFWYLGALMIVYIFIWFVFKINLNKKPMIIWSISVGISVILQLLTYLRGESLQKEVIQTFRQWTFIQYFMLGGMIPSIMPKIQKINIRLHGVILTVFCGVIPVYQLTMISRVGDPHAEFFYDDVITIIWSGLLFTFLMRLCINEKAEKIISSLVPLIMGVYIIHVLVIKAIVHFCPLDSFYKSLAAWGGVMLVSLLGAFILSKLPLANKLIKI